MGYKLQKKVYQTLEAGIYEATITEVVQETGDYGEQIKFTFTLDNSDTTLLAWAGASLSNKSKLGRWVSSIYGQLPDELDIENLEGRPVNIVVTVVNRPDGSTTNRVTEIMRRAVAPKPKPQPVASGQVDEIRF